MDNETLTPIKFSKEVSDFIQQTGGATDDFNNSEQRWFWIPIYFKKVDEQLFEVHVFKDLPNSLKKLLSKTYRQRKIIK